MNEAAQPGDKEQTAHQNSVVSFCGGALHLRKDTVGVGEAVNHFGESATDVFKLGLVLLNPV